MGLAIYRVKQEQIPYNGELGDEELDFLDMLLDERGFTYYYVESQLLNGVVQNCKAMGKEVPRKLTGLLQRMAKEEGFLFTVC